ncbi:hypothetical protein WDW86_10065 [Bdellovibrionota bacterium FG-2]
MTKNTAVLAIFGITLLLGSGCSSLTRDPNVIQASHDKKPNWTEEPGGKTENGNHFFVGAARNMIDLDGAIQAASLDADQKIVERVKVAIVSSVAKSRNSGNIQGTEDTSVENGNIPQTSLDQVIGKAAKAVLSNIEMSGQYWVKQKLEDEKTGKTKILYTAWSRKEATANQLREMIDRANGFLKEEKKMNRYMSNQALESAKELVDKP